MLNKEEKRIFDMYILPQLEKFENIYFYMDDLYEDELMFPDVPEGEYNEKEFPFRKVIGDMYEVIYETKKWIKAIRNSDYVNNQSFDEKWAKKDILRKKLRIEEEEIRKEAYKKGQEMATVRYNWLKRHSTSLEIKKEVKIHRKAYQEGLKSGREIERLTDEQILRKAEQITLKKKLGF